MKCCGRNDWGSTSSQFIGTLRKSKVTEAGYSRDVEKQDLSMSHENDQEKKAKEKCSEMEAKEKNDTELESVTYLDNSKKSELEVLKYESEKVFLVHEES